MKDLSAKQIDALLADVARMRPVFRAAMAESKALVAAEGPLVGDISKRLQILAQFYKPSTARRLRACARAARKGK